MSNRRSLQRRFALSLVALVPLSVGAALASCTSDDNASPSCSNGGVPCEDASLFDATGFDATGLDASGFDVQQVFDTSLPDAPLDSAQPAEDASEASIASDAGTEAADAADASFDANGPFIVASGLSSPSKLVLAGGYLFWSDSNDNIGQVSVNGGAVVHIDAGTGAFQMTADTNNVYWAGGASSMFQEAIGGTTASTIGHGVVFNPYMLLSNGGFLYWAEYSSSGSIQRIPIGGDVDAGTPITPPDVLLPTGIAFVGSQMYISVSDGTLDNGTISAVLPDGGLQNLVSGRYGPAGLITDGARLYWVDNGGSPDEVESIELDGGGGLDYSTNFLHPYLASDGVSLYILDYNGAIAKTPVGSVAITTLYDFSYDTGGLAVDETWVYWADEADGIIYKIEK